MIIVVNFECIHFKVIDHFQ